MGLPPETEYRAFDIDTRLAALVARFLRLSGRGGLAAAWDLLSPPPEEALGADLALLWKTLPLLEQQERGAGLKLLRGLPARWWIVSFPARSLGGREKGMREHYDRLARDLARLLRRPLRRLDLPNETFYILAPAE
ncbi:MAG: 16S rRNA methyltransferase, partial [Candidatus Eisenbacteria bacterium]|nr:16S rRNA methyltransferase [Candidatus Eisenbacteria bacterium]